MKNKYVSSPLFYVGGKEKLMSQIACYLPTDIERLIEPFVGDCSCAEGAAAQREDY